MSLILYGLPLSPFYRKVEMCLREKDIPFEAEAVNILPMPDWFKEISPAKRIPVLRDTEIGKEGVPGTIPDSSAICSLSSAGAVSTGEVAVAGSASAAGSQPW